MIGLGNIIKGVRKGHFLIPIPQKKWMQHLDENRPLYDRCVSSGKLYLVNGADD